MIKVRLPVKFISFKLRVWMGSRISISAMRCIVSRDMYEEAMATNSVTQGDTAGIK